MDEWEGLSESEQKRLFETEMDKAIGLSFRTLKAHRRVMLVREWRRRRAFERGLAEVYAPAFELFDHFLIAVHDVGEEANVRLRGLESSERDYLTEVLTRLQARACLVASEIRALMSSGHGSGALARWRTLHEIAVVACFLRQQEGQVAERYLLHDTLRRAKAMRQFVKYENRLGLEPIAPHDIECIFREEAMLIKRFGPNFNSDWGWAAGTMPGIPNFARIEEWIEMDHWRPSFGLASYSVHARFAGSAADIEYGPFQFTDFALSGPSWAGIAEPAQYSLLDLYNCTVALASYRSGEHQYVQLGVLEHYGAECTAAFLNADKVLQSRSRS